MASGVRHGWPASFADRLTSPVPTWRDAMRISIATHLRTHRDTTPGAPHRPAPIPSAQPSQIAITWVGHATCVVQIGGVTVLTDPVWSDRLLGLCRRRVAPGVAWEELPRVDAVVISHNHRDHLDEPTITRLPRDTPIMAPAALAGWFVQRGFEHVTELDWWESTTVGEVRLDFVPAHHWSQRTASDVCRTLWGGWILTAADGARVYFAGDTGWGGWFTEIGARYPGIEVAILPIGAYALGRNRSPMHLDPEQAVRACVEVGAPHLMPMHWGTFRLSSEPLHEPIELVRAAWADGGGSEDRLLELAVGETRILTAAADGR